LETVTILGVRVLPRKHLHAIRTRWLVSSACQMLVRQFLASSGFLENRIMEEVVKAIVAVSVATA
jgi:hypothetical protein